MSFKTLQIPPGIERNGTPYETPNRWWDMSQVRWISGTLQPIGGWQRQTLDPLDSPPRAFHVWRDNGTARAILAGSDEKIYVDNSGEFQDITPDSYMGPGAVQPVGGYGTGPYGSEEYGTARSTPSPIYSPYGILSFGQWGQDVIICSNTDGRLLYYKQDAPLAAPVAIGPSYSPADTAEFTASISTTTMTVSAVASGAIQIGDKITGVGVSTGTVVTAFGTGLGGTGTYTVSISQTVGSITMEAFNQITTGAPVSNTAVIVTPERHVMAIGASGNQKMIAWSSREDQTDWNFSSVTNTAGFLQLSSRTPLLYAVPVAEGTLVFSYTDVFLIRYVGQPSIYGGTSPISDTALFNPQSVAVFGGRAVWPSRQGFQLYTGGSVQPLPCPIMADLMEGEYAMDPLWGPFRIHGCHNAKYPEIWWFYPSVGNTECNRYIGWNYVENVWFWGELARSAMSPADAFQYPLMGGTDGHIYSHENGVLANGASRVGQIWSETGALSLGAGDNVIHIDQLQIATGKGFGNLHVTFHGVYAPEGQEYIEGPHVPSDDGCTYCRLEYRDVRIKFTNAQDGNFSIGTIRMNVIPGGQR